MFPHTGIVVVVVAAAVVVVVDVVEVVVVLVVVVVVVVVGQRAVTVPDPSVTICCATHSESMSVSMVAV